MTIQQCKYILEIAKTGSFSEAAKQLFVAQSGLSSSIKLLEQELNIKIFERSKNGVCLSSDGAEFIRYAEQIVKQSDFIINRYTSPASTNRLYVSTQHYDFVADIFCNLLSETTAEQYDFSIREIQTYEVIREVESAFCDIGIIAIKNNDFDIMSRYLQKKAVQFHQLLISDPHVYVRREHPIAGADALTYDALIPYTYLSYEQGSHNASFFTEELIGEFKGQKHVTISDRATLMNVLLTTDCYTVGTGIMPSALNNGKIVSRRLKSDSYYRIGYLLRKDGAVSHLSKRFIHLLNEFAIEYANKKLST